MTFYFSFIVVVLSVSLMNSVTVLLVEVAREQSETKRAIENKIKGMRTQGFDSWYQSDVPRFRFLRIRKGNTEAELEMIPDAVRDELLNITGKGTVNDVFELLDDDKSGREVRRGQRKFLGLGGLLTGTLWILWRAQHKLCTQCNAACKTICNV